MKRFVAPITWLVFACLVSGSALSQSYPSKPVRLVVPYPAGGVVDVLGRIIAEAIATNWGQQIIVEPRPGANAMIGTENVLNSPPDGYTWLLASQSHAANAALYPDLRWDPAKDFVAAGLFARSVNYFVVPTSLPVSDLRSYVAMAKAQPNKLSYGNPGNGTPSHLAFELFKRAADVEIEAIGYKGNPPLLADLITGRLSATILTAVLTNNNVKTGRIKPLAVMAEERTKEYPDVPTLAEAGYPDAQILSWFAVVIPAKVPPEVQNRIAAEVEKAAKAPVVQERLRKAGAVPSFVGAADFTAQIRKDVEIWKRVVKQAGIKAD